MGQFKVDDPTRLSHSTLVWFKGENCEDEIARRGTLSPCKYYSLTRVDTMIPQSGNCTVIHKVSRTNARDLSFGVITQNSLQPCPSSAKFCSDT